MFRLAREMVDRGGRAITTTTTRIFGAQIALAPAHVPAADATRERVAAALAAHRHVLVIGATEAGSGKAEGVSLDLFRRLRAWFPDVCILNEADGSRMRPFKAPADVRAGDSRRRRRWSFPWSAPTSSASPWTPSTSTVRSWSAR